MERLSYNEIPRKISVQLVNYLPKYYFDMGINQEIIPHLFSKFKTKSEKGLGLGLFISKSIIEAHQGKLEAYNNVDSNGATFVVTLPLQG